MKKLFTLIVIVAMTISVFAQSPQKMSYQAVIRDAGNALVTSHVVGMQISILQGSATGTPVYVETQTPTTNANGLVTIEIGGGTIITGTFEGIDWSAGTYYMKTEVDPTGGINYTITGTSQILSVPYSLYSQKAKTTDYNGLTNKLTAGNGISINGSNQIINTLPDQTVSITGLKGITVSGTYPNFTISGAEIYKTINKLLLGTLVLDIDGNYYNTINIGTQVWMAENLRTSKLNDGTPIPKITNDSQWRNAIDVAYCWYNNDSATYEIPYGKLYNAYVASNTKICPVGWHVPSLTEWNTMLTYLGGAALAANKLKEAGTSHWLSSSPSVTNETGFTALPGGSRHYIFGTIRTDGYWWSRSLLKLDYSIIRMTATSSVVQNTGEDPVYYGNSIRCLKN